MKPRDVVDRYFRAMASGPDAESDLMALFAPDAVYVEPFSGSKQTHRGADAIRDYLRRSWTDAPPDLELTVERVDVDGDVVKSEWTCTSPAFPEPIRGLDECTVRDGRIHKLEVSFLP